MWASMCCSNWRRRWSRIGSHWVPARTGSRSKGLAARASGGAGLLQAEGGRSVAFVGVNGPQFNVAVFASALAGMPITPLNYRLPDAELNALIDRLDEPVVLVDDDMRERVGDRPRMLSTTGWLAATATAPPIEAALPR